MTVSVAHVWAGAVMWGAGAGGAVYISLAITGRRHPNVYHFHLVDEFVTYNMFFLV